MKRPTVRILVVMAALWIGGCGRNQAPEPVSEAPQVTADGSTPVPPMTQQRQDKRGD